MAEQGKFNKQLAYALSTLVIDLPPLSDREDDMDQLERVKVEVGVGNQNPAIGQRCRPCATTNSAEGFAAGDRRRNDLRM
mgnify:CR=1 FL=1